MAYEFHKASVLIVEDNLPMVELIKSVIDTFGFKDVYTANDGEEGFETFCRYNPDLVVSDWMMKPTNGIEMAHKIRQSDKSPNKFVPIILLTGFSQKQRVIEARDTGITEFVVKPFKAGDLYKRIESIIEAPRDFVESESFFGPDRRRRILDLFRGPFRRNEDHAKNNKSSSISKDDDAYRNLMKQQKVIENNAIKNKDPLIVDFAEKKKDD